MRHLITQILGGLAVFLTALAAMPATAFAAMNPDTGDPSERIMGWVFIALGVSLIVIIILFVVLGKNRKE